MTRTFAMLAAVVGFTGVALGAFGAHGLAAHFEANPNLEPTFQTASEYHLVHALALVAAAWAAERWPGRLTGAAGWLFLLGVLLFSGSLYVLSIFNVRFMGAVAPLGGLSLLAGWACLGLAAWRAR
jgi:uncharacterized membrane protein YgdD (TMEM256/DUF423 family)